MVQVNFEVTGVEELTRKLNKNNLLRKPLRKMFFAIANMLKKEVKTAVPVVSGKLASSIKIKVDRDVIPMYCKVYSSWYVARFLERGTKRGIAPRWYFKNVLEENRDRINEYIKKAEQNIQEMFNRGDIPEL